MTPGPDPEFNPGFWPKRGAEPNSGIDPEREVADPDVLRPDPNVLTPDPGEELPGVEKLFGLGIDPGPESGLDPGSEPGLDAGVEGPESLFGPGIDPGLESGFDPGLDTGGFEVGLVPNIGTKSDSSVEPKEVPGSMSVFTLGCDMDWNGSMAAIPSLLCGGVNEPNDIEHKNLQELFQPFQDTNGAC